jgi:hypothetical protein
MISKFSVSLILYMIALYSNLCHAAITCTSSIKDLRILFDSKLHFHNHVDFICRMHKAIRSYSLRNLQIFFPELSVCAVHYVSRVQVGICLSSLEFYHAN